jgi:phosphatidylethanolamine-binding protein (PEBP) family uncharacterized protein
MDATTCSQRLAAALLAASLFACGHTSPVDTDATTADSTATHFTLSSSAVAEDGVLPAEYTCDGASSSLALSWTGAPAATRSFALIMHHVASPTDVHWYWVQYDIPASLTSLARNSTGIGLMGTNSVNGKTAYAPPCSQGPGAKTYILTLYALSSAPQLSVPASQITRDVLLAAIHGAVIDSATLHVTYTRPDSAVVSDSTANTAAPDSGGTPPAEAFAACVGRQAGDACSFSWTRGSESGECENVQGQLACSPHREATGTTPGGGAQDPGTAAYNLEQAISDRAQGMTIAYDALAFLTGDLGADSFFPPGKVADFWGFQYLRDNDPSQMGHAGEFLTSAALNVLNVLTPAQRAQLVALAESQTASIAEYGYRRFVLMDAFRRLLREDLPAGTTGLDEEAVKAYSAQLYQLDGSISYDRARLMGSLTAALDSTQKAYLDAMVGKGMLTWPEVSEPADIAGLERAVKVATMTYAADLFSWYAGSVNADVYFCPERHGTYFGSFYLKDIRAMSDPSYAIPTDLTGNLGDSLLTALNPTQAARITGLVDIQRPSLTGIVSTRLQVATELRRFLSGQSADEATVSGLMQQYGELDGEIICRLATTFAEVGQSLTDEQKSRLMAMRQELLGSLLYPTGAYLYSEPIAMPGIPSSDFLFAAGN